MQWKKSDTEFMLLYVCILLPFLCALGQRVPTACFREGEIALTFDQGPSYYTGILLNILKRENVKAAFHVTPDYLDNPVIMAYLRRAAQDGHAIGLYVKEAEMGNEEVAMAYIKKMCNKLQPHLGQKIVFIRFAHPGPAAGLLKRVHDAGFVVTGYNLDSTDYSFKGFSSEIAIEKVINSFRMMLDSIVAPARGSFVTIQRDLLDYSVSATESFIKYAKEKGYNFVRLDQCVLPKNTQLTKLDDPDNFNSPQDGMGPGDESLGVLQHKTSGLFIVVTILMFIVVFF